MEPLGLGAATVALFVGFGLFVGILFGFFGMGGSFLVTPVLLVTGYPTRVAVGSGLAFVFGTSVVGALRHRNLGHVDYALAAPMILGTTIGIEIGTRVLFLLESHGSAGQVIGVAYVGLLALLGLFTTWDARRDGHTGFEVAGRVQAVRLPSRVRLAGDFDVSVWVLFGVGGAVGTLSGSLGVGGGFLLLPAMVYGLGVPTAVAVGSSVLQVTVSSAYGTFVYAGADAVALSAVAPLLAGSALGARIGSRATTLVDEDDVEGYFAAMLLVGSLSLAATGLGGHLDIEAFDTVGVVLVFGAPVLVSAAIVRAAVSRLRRENEHGSSAVSGPGD